MSRLRRCDSRCHDAKGSRCKCWCSSTFHSSKGLINRSLIADGKLRLSDLPGYKAGHVVYTNHLKLSLVKV